ncbi:MAG: YqaA family protein [Methylococcaceae bacterium]|jgi:membrane protein YqaA with SNARE-associated domain
MEWLNHWTHENSLWGLFLSAFISSTIAPGGSELVLAYLVRTAAHPTWQLIMMASVGNTLGALTTWQLGSWTARRFPLNSAVLDKHPHAARWVRRFGPVALLFSWLPIIGDGLCYVAGWLRLPLFFSFAAISVGKVGRYWAMTVLIDRL